MFRPWRQFSMQLCFGLLLWSSRSWALETDTPRELEMRVWTADEQELPNVEKAVVKLIQRNPYSATGHQLLAHVLVRLFSKDPGDIYLLKQASTLAQQAIDLEPRAPGGYAALADILDLMGNADKGLKLLDQAEASGVKPNWRFCFTRARLLGGEAGSAKALSLLEKALTFSDSEPRMVVPYVIALLQADANGEALVQRLEDWSRRYPSPLFATTLAISYADLGKFAEAHAIYGRVIKADPKNKEAKVNDAILLYRDLKEPAKGAALLEQILTEHDKDLSPPVKAMVASHLGAAYLRRGLWDKAEASFISAANAQPESAGMLDFMTRAYREAKHHDKLAHLLTRLNDSVPGSGVLHALLGETLSEHLHRHDDALQAFADAITLEPDRSDFYNGMGLAFYRKRSYPDALKLFVAATEIDPNDATAHYNEACVLSLMGKREEAISSLAEAVTLDPRLMQNARSDADFVGIKDNLRFREIVQSTPQPDFGVSH